MQSKKLALLISFLLYCYFNGALAGVVVLNGLSHLHQANQGDIQKGRIEIQNQKGNVKSVKIYQRDYLFFNTGEAFYDAPGTNARSNAKWMDIAPTYLTLQPNEKAIINYVIKVPSDESLIGTYWSVVMIEEVSNPNINEIQKGVTINTLIRYAVQISTTIGGSGKKELKFTNLAMNKEDGKNQLVVDIDNPGQCLLKPQVSIELFNIDGKSVGIFSVPPVKIYPGTSIRSILEMTGIPAGNYQAILLADCGEESVFGINLAMNINDD